MTAKVLRQKIVFGALSLSTLAMVAPVVAVFYLLISNGAAAINWSFLTQPPRDNMMAGGLMPALVGTLWLLAGTVLLSVPVGVLAAVYLSEYAPANMFTRLIRLAIVNLAGVPSIVFGLFGYALFVLYLGFGRSILSGSLTLALMVLPVIITSAEEALQTVPRSFRDGSLALGATKWQTIWRIVLPNSMAGIITGVVLGIGRAAGETAPIMLTAAVFYVRELPHGPKDACMALPYQLYVLTSEALFVSDKMKWGTALVLLMLVLSMSIIATLIRSHFRRSRTW